MSDETIPAKSPKPIKDRVDELLKPLSKPDSRQPGTLFIRRDLLDLCGGDHLQALLLNQIIHWSDSGWKSGWVVKSYDDWHNELGMTQYQVNRAINGDTRTKAAKTKSKKKAKKSLKDLGVETEKHVSKMYADKPVTHYRLNLKKFEKAVADYLREKSNINNVDFAKTHTNSAPSREEMSSTDGIFDTFDDTSAATSGGVDESNLNNVDVVPSSNMNNVHNNIEYSTENTSKYTKNTIAPSGAAASFSTSHHDPTGQPELDYTDPLVELVSRKCFSVMETFDKAQIKAVVEWLKTQPDATVERVAQFYGWFAPKYVDIRALSGVDVFRTYWPEFFAEGRKETDPLVALGEELAPYSYQAAEDVSEEIPF